MKFLSATLMLLCAVLVCQAEMSMIVADKTIGVEESGLQVIKVECDDATQVWGAQIVVRWDGDCATLTGVVEADVDWSNVWIQLQGTDENGHYAVIVMTAPYGTPITLAEGVNKVCKLEWLAGEDSCSDVVYANDSCGGGPGIWTRFSDLDGYPIYPDYFTDGDLYIVIPE